MGDVATNVLSTEKIKLLTQKGVFPNEYFDSREKLKETQLPPKEKFFSTLNTVSGEDCEHAQRVWSEFKCKNFIDYAHLYMKTDVLLFSDFFENFRNQCLKAYELDPAHYYTTPCLSWDAMLKYTKVKLELLTDIDKLLFIKLSIKSGVNQCSNRYAKANNPYMDCYNGNEEIVYAIYFDENNLYR